MIGGVALGAVGYEAIKMSMNFQSAMERLVTQAGVPQKMLGPLKSGILELAGSVGFSPDSLSESLYHVASNMASLGASAPKMLSMVKTAAEGAAVGGANLDDVTNALTAAVASGIPGVQNFGQAMGALNAIVGAGDMKMQDLANAMGTGVLATVKGYGLSLKDVGAALDVFGDNNIRGSHAAQELRMAVQALAAPAAAGKSALAGMGLSMTTLAGDMQKGGLLKALEDLQTHMKKAGITAKEQGAEITEIFGKKAGTGLNVLLDQMDRLKSKYPDITKGANDFGNAWKRTQDTASQQFKELKSTVESLMTSIGDKLLPVVEGLARFLLKNKGIIQDLAGPVLAIVGAFMALKLVMAGIQLVSDLNPWTIAILAVAVAAEELITHWKEVEKIAKEVFKAVKDAVTDAVNWVRKEFDDLRHDTAEVFDDVRHTIASKFDQARHDISTWFDDVRTWFVQLPGKILHALGNLGTLLINAGKDVVRGLINGVKSMLGDVGKVAGDIGHTLLSGVKDVLGIFSPSREAFTHGQMYGQGLINGLKSMQGPVRAAAAGLAGSVSQGAGSASLAGAAAGGGGNITIQITPNHSSGLDGLFMTWLKGEVRASGGDPRIFNKKVQFQ